MLLPYPETSYRFCHRQLWPSNLVRQLCKVAGKRKWNGGEGRRREKQSEASTRCRKGNKKEASFHGIVSCHSVESDVRKTLKLRTNSVDMHCTKMSWKCHARMNFSSERNSYSLFLGMDTHITGGLMLRSQIDDTEDTVKALLLSETENTTVLTSCLVRADAGSYDGCHVRTIEDRDNKLPQTSNQ